MFICSYPPKWLIIVLPLPSLWFYEQNLSRYRLQNSLTVYSSADILSRHGKYAEQSANIFSIQHTFGLRRGRRVLCNFVRRKTNMRARCKLSVNWWKVHRDRQLSNFATKLNFDSPLHSTLPSVWSNVGVRGTGRHQRILMRDEMGQLPRSIMQERWR